MRSKLFKDLSASSAQVLVNQLLGLLVFVITSYYLDKSVYGEFNWSLAVLTFVTTLLSLRLEQVVVKKIAAGEDASKLLSVLCGHVFVSGVLFYLCLLAGSFLFPSFFTRHSLLLLLAVSQVLSFFSMPFKQLATGKEKYRWLAVMSCAGNLVRSVFLVSVVLFASLTVQQVIWVYIVSSVAELLLSVYLVQKHLKVPMAGWSSGDYLSLIRESVPQIGVVFLNACIARIDWILLGFFSTQVITAEYSFAYKVFELSPVPLLIIGPLLLTRFSAWFGKQPTGVSERQKKTAFLIRMEMILATFFPLLLNIIWSPFVDALTQNKYGAVNQLVFFLLSAAIPFQYLINVFWSMHFAQNRLKMIFRTTFITACIIVCGDLLMIPMLGGKGAAAAYLVAMVVECIMYGNRISFVGNRDKWLPLVFCISIALLSGGFALLLNVPIFVKVAAAAAVYVALLFASKQLQRADLVFLKRWLFPVTAKYKPV
ncbi:oligosaccharide flippase family protein [Sediminibacterium roseum]|uniref:Oligosaccharide flippase family protein n=1 Tax=Sediminibacterium roseum TaxID=1978412 RepID=A0ABW9ZU18_9BACT|nr:oligosaccharide flippase family protein [Sediminibacterium roseum]NCI50636.1 oligosaccharide flippase family protein [Sediminibacterium roseum]